MNEKDQIYNIISKNPGVFASKIVKLGNFSQRTYVSRLLSQLVAEKRIRREKQGRNVIYFVSDVVIGLEENLKLKGLHEDEIWAKLRKTTTFLNDISEQAENILYFAFTEMLNNAIDHSHSGVGYAKIWLEDNKLKFIVKDSGIGVFKNVMAEKHLASETEAIQEIVKGKLTTAARRHSGEGIFWTSKIADKFILKSYKYELVVDNNIEDYTIKKLEKNLIGTEVYFEISKNTSKSIRKIFRDYTFDTEHLTLDTTAIPINLYSEGDIWISRSQAKKVLAGLDKYKKIIFNFAGVEVIGQAFADEIFRVFNIEHPDIILEPINMSDSVKLMVSHAQNDLTGRNKL
ncbi:DUF4325 domain-containing protein [Candidatus Saccharibacteria bacterium]|nr:DUF4325 domain-containing protein [Candidatus Saccharibacteria bacterium]MBQ6149444.1 DUF4325 domain-containing protein [Candidatus Saccharibacteria bacterium]